MHVGCVRDRWESASVNIGVTVQRWEHLVPTMSRGAGLVRANLHGQFTCSLNVSSS